MKCSMYIIHNVVALSSHRRNICVRSANVRKDLTRKAREKTKLKGQHFLKTNSLRDNVSQCKRAITSYRVKS